MTPKLLLTAIIKDDSEAKMVERMLASFMPHVDGLAVAITGTSGNHEKIKSLVHKYKGEFIVTTPETHPSIYAEIRGKMVFANFAEARNASFALAETMQEKGKYDYWVWADADDTIVSGEELKQCAEQALKRKLDAVLFDYWYSVHIVKKVVKEVIIQHTRERLIKPGVFKWISRLHEVAVPKDGHYKPRLGMWDINLEEGRKCVWVHLADESRTHENMMRNIDILEIQVREENYKDPRTLFYLGKTHYDIARFYPKEAAINLKAAEDYIKDYIPLSGWGEERAGAWEYLGDIAVMRGDRVKAIEDYTRAIGEYGVGHMKYLKLAREYYNTNQDELGDFWLEAALRMDPPKSRTTMGNPMDVKLLAIELKYNRAVKESNLEEAIKWVEKRQQLVGDDGGKELVKSLNEALDMERAAKNIFNYAKWLKDKGHKNQLKHIMDIIAPEFKEEKFVQVIANDVVEPRKWPKKSIVYFAGPSFEAFDPTSVDKKGLGGSETAIVMLSKEWAKLGYEVVVYCMCLEEGKYEGVTYRNWNKINWNDTFDTIILWRNPAVLDVDIQARKILVDLHDVASQLDWTQERMEKVDYVMFKSNYHRKMVPKLPDSKAKVISNGL